MHKFSFAGIHIGMITPEMNNAEKTIVSGVKIYDT